MHAMAKASRLFDFKTLQIQHAMHKMQGCLIALPLQKLPTI
jgi:hypothetical protein